MGGEVIQLSKKQIRKLAGFLQDRGFERESLPGTLFVGRKESSSVIAYESGEVLIQDEEANELLNAIVRNVVLVDDTDQDAFPASRYQFHVDPSLDKGYIGTDESGKGDYFGPLVVGGVRVTRSDQLFLQDLNIRDSKEMGDDAILDAAGKLKARCIHYVVVIGPEKYNQLYEQMKNLNRILAWGHARAIENILQKVDCEAAITDQFGDERYVQRALMEKGKQIELVQRPKAESDPAVAAASVLARAEFLRRLEKLSKTVGTKLPKGSSERVEHVARQLVSKFGEEVLRRCAKFHFKTTQHVLKQAFKE